MVDKFNCAIQIMERISAMLNVMKNLKSSPVAIASVVAILAVIIIIMQKGFASAQTDTRHDGSAKPAVMSHAAINVAKAAGGTGSVQGKPVVIEGSLLNGGHLNTAKWKGKVVVIDFWATWCPWCRAEMPSMEKMYSKYHSHGLEIVGVPLSDTAAAVRSYLKSNPKVAWPEIFDKGLGNAALARKMGVSAFPAQCVIDRQGIWRYTVVGAAHNQLGVDMQKLIAVVRKVLNKGKGHP